jgi:hypothetical protein
MDAIETFNQNKLELERILKSGELNEDTKKIIAKAMDFGYSASFCSSRYDKLRSEVGDIKYSEEYIQIRELLENGK